MLRFELDEKSNKNPGSYPQIDWLRRSCTINRLTAASKKKQRQGFCYLALSFRIYNINIRLNISYSLCLLQGLELVFQASTATPACPVGERPVRDAYGSKGKGRSVELVDERTAKYISQLS